MKIPFSKITNGISWNRYLL